MIHALEYHGRLIRPDGRVATPGLHDLCFRLHPSVDGESVLWEEQQSGVRVGSRGQFHVILGDVDPLRPDLFEGAPRYLSVRYLRDGRPAEEASERTTMAGLSIHMAAAVTRLEANVAMLDSLARSIAVALRRTRVLRTHLRVLERGEGPLAAIGDRLNVVQGRLARLDSEEGRVTHLEDELEDIVGPDGDVVDLTERMDALERRLRLVDRLDALEQRLAGLEARQGSGT